MSESKIISQSDIMIISQESDDSINIMSGEKRRKREHNTHLK